MDEPESSANEGKEPSSAPSAWDRFWRRYSPYGEFPRSSASSLALHLVVVLLLIWLSGALKPKERVAPGVDVVAVGDDADVAPGFGDGLPSAGPALSESLGLKQPNDAPAPDAMPTEEVNTAVEPSEVAADTTVPTAAELAAEAEQAVRTASSAAQQARRSLDRARERLAQNQNQQGKGGGSVSATGTGGGGGTGATGRAARSGRWVLHFKHTSYDDLLAQYDGLGAELAFPVANDAYRYFDHLTMRPPRSRTADLAKESRLYWVEDSPVTVSGLAAALGTASAPFMLAFLPQTLEEKMLKLELAYANLREDQIAKTEFEVVRRAGGYDVIVVSQIPR